MNQATFTWPGRRQDDPVHALINAYLVIDIQNSPNGIKEVLNKITEVKANKLSTWQRIGNAYTLTLYPDAAEIEEDYSGEVVSVPLEDFEKAAYAWSECCH